MIQLSETSTPELRDGVEVFLYPQEDERRRVLILFLSSRRRLRLDCRPAFALLLKQFARKNRLAASLAEVGLQLDEKVRDFVLFLANEGIVTLSDPLATDLLPAAYIEQYKRQLYFLMDITRYPEKAISVQKRIFEAHITIFGLGAVGGSILQQLCMMGFRKFDLIDYSDIDACDISRSPYRVMSDMGKSKSLAAKDMVEGIAFNPVIKTHKLTLKTATQLDKIVSNTSAIINTADEPYIGFINIKLSRYAVAHGIPLFVAGGFDAHLASLGEMIIPHVTPCADCYANFFDESLKNWKPVPHPVRERRGWFGGLGSLSVFSASAAVIDILNLFMGEENRREIQSGRGEFLFHDYSLDNFIVEKDEKCQVCGCNED